MLELLKTHFGYETFRPLQEDIINTILQKKDALVLMPTGGGKSLCFQLPALMFDGLTLVISPLIALMKDQVDSLVENGIQAAYLNSSLTTAEIRLVERRACSGELKILYLAPERIASLEFQLFLRTLNVSFIAIDEAHCISEWGHDFRPDYRLLKDLRLMFPSVPVMALTATATVRVREDIKKQLSLSQAKVFLSSFNRPNLHYAIRPKNNAYQSLVHLLKPYKDKPVIIYCFSRKDTEALAHDLASAGFLALPYHAGLEREVRKQTQEKFIRDEVPIIVATIAFGMGIDKPDVRLVVHMDLPKTIEGYYQETGRAGRDGLNSDCVLFYTFGDKRKHEYFIEMIEDEAEQLAARKKLSQVIDYCETSSCRRKFLLEYFAEPWAVPVCNACDNCVLPNEEEHDTTEIAQKILSAVLRTGEMFGAAYVCDVLRGSKKGRILENNHERLSVYGSARTVSVDDLREFIRHLVKKGYLEKNEGEYPTLRVSRMGKAALTERATILLPKATPEFKVPSGTFKPTTSRIDNLSFESELFEQLRALRKKIADDQNVPPFIIFGDRTLQEMAYYFPLTLDSLAGLFGIGARKLEAYGEAFLEIIQSWSQSHNLTSRAHPKPKNQPSSMTIIRPSSTLEKTRELIEQEKSIPEMARARGVVEGTIIQYLMTLRIQDPTLNIEHLRPDSERLRVIHKAIEDAHTSMLGPVKAILGDEYSWDEIKLAKLFL
ncbi:MAG: DNA helicase RecQ [Patescibacteria group bacterium]